MGTAVRAKSPFAILALFLGAVVLIAIAGVKSGAMTPLAAKVTLGITIPILFASVLGAIPRGRAAALRPGWRPAEVASAAEDDLQRGSEAERVHRWRSARLAALGVAEETAVTLAAQPAFSVHDLDRLLEAGCPLRTAVRILWPS
jgi:hypothetical protein